MKPFSYIPHPMDARIEDFHTFRDRPEFSGLSGFAFLTYHMRCDRTRIIKKNDIPFSPRPPQKYYEIQSLVSSFGSHWTEWSKSPFSVLTGQEAMVVDRYLINRDPSIVARHVNLPLKFVISSINKAIHKLKAGHIQSQYHEWLHYRNMGRTSERDYFLTAPFHGLKSILPTSLRINLGVIGDNMSEILVKYSEKELLEINGIGKKSLKEIKNLLIKFNCIELLRIQ